nr:ALPV-004 [Albatrosspox virus]UNS14520.1 ALPV-356 [Albatrosspox virus]
MVLYNLLLILRVRFTFSFARAPTTPLLTRVSY